MTQERITKITEASARKVVPKRKPDTHKGDYGRVLVIAGYGGMPGAVLFCSKAALVSGCGLCYVSTSRGSTVPVQVGVPEVIIAGWDEVCEKWSGRPDAFDYDVVAFGPGMGRGRDARKMLKTLLLSYTGVIVLDADGLNLVAEDSELSEFARNYLGTLIITPHPGEAARLLPEGFDADSREEVISELIRTYRAVTVLKGDKTLVGRLTPETEEIDDADIEILMNTTGNPGMAVGGSGDVLTGMIASFVAQGNDPWDAARAAVYIHGLSGDIAAEEKGEYGMIASDILESVPYAIMKVQNH